MGFGFSKVSNARDREMVNARAEPSKGAMVLYDSDGDVREYWHGSCYDLVKVDSPIF